jgi:hypothetical protein
MAENPASSPPPPDPDPDYPVQSPADIHAAALFEMMEELGIDPFGVSSPSGLEIQGLVTPAWFLRLYDQI